MDVYRHVKEEYIEMEEIKIRYMKSFTERVGEDIIEVMKKIIYTKEKRIRGSYNQTTEWIKSEDFVDLILHDSVFIMEIIISYYEVEQELIEKSRNQLPFNIEMVKKDLIMLENQLPFFIFDSFFMPIVDRLLLSSSSFEEIILRFFGLIFRQPITNFNHFTDMFRSIYEHSLDRNIRQDMKIEPSEWPAGSVRTNPRPNTKKKSGPFAYKKNTIELYKP